SDGRIATRAVLRSCGFGTICTVVSTMLGLVVVIECSRSAAASALLVAPILVVFIAYRAYLSERSQSEGLQFLYTASELLNRERDVEFGLLALLDFARDTFHAVVAEIWLSDAEHEGIGYRIASGPGTPSGGLERVSSDVVARVIDVASASPGAIVQCPEG